MQSKAIQADLRTQQLQSSTSALFQIPERGEQGPSHLGIQPGTLKTRSHAASLPESGENGHNIIFDSGKS